jgi:hypothetical protein
MQKNKGIGRATLVYCVFDSKFESEIGQNLEPIDWTKIEILVDY